jgi:hypothetical protein
MAGTGFLVVDQIIASTRTVKVYINLDHVWMVSPSKARFWEDGKLTEHETSMLWLTTNFTDAEGDHIEVDESYEKIIRRIYAKTEKKCC